ncbi:conjugal transfer protein MobB [Bacteroides sp. 224]|uniref:conjugal transfer protein MobB n=1 Tax=Bacteroides sp. 224 TaxID=2302936 RepID=UPI0013CFFA2A|nr:conjugal transfer protein MobB [Bacteroides sp. 224]NDV64670.1 mobilization protein [Bacteroides sp. 224]
MVAKITTGNDLYGALAYNQEKVDKEKGKVLSTHILREPTDGKFSVPITMEDFQRWMPTHYRTEKPVIHISLNPDPKDNVSEEQLSEIAEKYMERMGWGGQPYIVFKHSDIDREHIHIVSVQVRPDGKKIKDSKRNERSVAITECLEKEYGLLPAKGQSHSEKWQFTPIDHTKGNLKKQIASVVKPAAAMYRFQTLGEFRALLSLYNIGIEEVRGVRSGKPYRGLLYTALEVDGSRAEVTPLKASLFGKAVGFDALERLMKHSGEKINKDNIREKARRRVEEALLNAPDENILREKLRLYNIDLYLRRNDSGRITGVTFIDHENRSVLNGSRLGKQFSANAFNELFGEFPRDVEHTDKAILKEPFTPLAEPFKEAEKNVPPPNLDKKQRLVDRKDRKI